MTITEFILARIREDEALAKQARYGHMRQHGDLPYPLCGLETKPSEQEANHAANWSPARVLAQCEAMRRIVVLHEAWPVLVEAQPTFEPVASTDPSAFAMRASQQIAWMSQQEYRTRFGDEPPTAPMLAALAAIWSDHPDYDETWRL